MHFKIVGKIKDVEVIASGTAIRERKRLWKLYGKARWREVERYRKLEFPDGKICQAEVHWYEAHGIGAKEHKIKRIIE